ncbi:ATP-binding protein [Streptomyces sp. NPDC058872]|uniref:ATP-binding protein n=1 Tax=Streptomyces sp. NPDC058872 TaxID=3346661 RepID=UPI0036C2B62D
MDCSTAPRVGPTTVHLRLPSGAQAPRRARRTTERMLADPIASCPRSVADDILLVVSELVTNAVVHAEGPYALTLSLEDGRVGVVVSDASSALPRAGSGRKGTEQGGRGLKIVRALGAEVFVSPSDHGKQVVAVLSW